MTVLVGFGKGCWRRLLASKSSCGGNCRDGLDDALGIVLGAHGLCCARLALLFRRLVVGNVEKRYTNCAGSCAFQGVGSLALVRATTGSARGRGRNIEVRQAQGGVTCYGLSVSPHVANITHQQAWRTQMTVNIPFLLRANTRGSWRSFEVYT